MSAYTPELVKHLLPAVWDQAYAYGMTPQYAPDPTMPRGKPDPAVSGTLNAHLADVRRAWERAALTEPQRVALVLRFGLDWTTVRIGEEQGVSQPTISSRVKRGVSTMTDYLNGETAG